MKVCVVGAGRVGLPLALALESREAEVDIVDFDANVLKAFDIKKMPFYEPTCQDLLNISNIRAFHPDDDGLCNTAYDYFIITVGTPLAQHIETDLSAVKSVIKWLVEKKLIHTNTSIILRSTVAPYTTQYVRNMLLSYNIHCTVAMCPERLAEGTAIEEIFKLPQIVGVESDEDFNKIHKLFSILDVKILKMSYIEAELSKLFCNIYRYINFAIPNYFMYLADHFGVKDIFGLFANIKDEYPRMKNLASPGFTAGTCVPGNRMLKIYDEYSNILNVSIQELYNMFDNDKKYYIDSYSADIVNSNTKEIENVITRKYTGKMLTFEFIFNSKSFTCTADHLLPIKRNGELLLVRAYEILSTDRFLIDKVNKICAHQIYKITSEDVVDFDVFNIELHSLEDGDDLYYRDEETRIIHHNCLRKDFGMINEYFPQTDLLLQAYKINEFMPKFIVDSAKEENIRGKNILVLGYTFKQDTDDTRDSLVPKLLQYIDRYNPATVTIHDPNLPYSKFTDKFNKIEFDNISYEQLSNTSFDTCFIGTNHSVFKTIEYELIFAGSKHIIDIWNCTNNSKFKGE